MSANFKYVDLKIEPDDDPPNPCKDYDLAGTMVFFHRRMELGHPHDFAKDTFEYTDEFGGVYDDHYEDSPSGFMQWMKDNESRILAIPVYAYNAHGGITIRAGGKGVGWDSFDSGQLGYIYITHDNIRKEWGVPGRKSKNISKAEMARAEACLIAEVNAYDDYLNGNCYGYRVMDKETGETLDSCWGFLGDEEECRAEGEASAKFYEKERRKAERQLQARLDAVSL